MSLSSFAASRKSPLDEEKLKLRSATILIFVLGPRSVPQHTLFVQEPLSPGSSLGCCREGIPSAMGSCCCKHISSTKVQWGMFWRHQHLRNLPTVVTWCFLGQFFSVLIKLFSACCPKANLYFSRIFLSDLPKRKDLFPGRGRWVCQWLACPPGCLPSPSTTSKSFFSWLPKSAAVLLHQPAPRVLFPCRQLLIASVTKTISK